MEIRKDEKICNKCGRQLPVDCFYGRNKVCKECYNAYYSAKKKKYTHWHCKYCGTADETKAYYSSKNRRRFCVDCLHRDIPKKYIEMGWTEWKCIDCGETDIKKRRQVSMRCSQCARKRQLEKGQVT